MARIQTYLLIAATFLSSYTSKAAPSAAVEKSCEEDSAKLAEDEKTMEDANDKCKVYEDRRKTHIRSCPSLKEGQCDEFKSLLKGFKERAAKKKNACQILLHGIVVEQCRVEATKEEAEACEERVKREAEEYNRTYDELLAEDKAARAKITKLVDGFKEEESKIQKCIDDENERCKVQCCVGDPSPICQLPPVPGVKPLYPPGPKSDADELGTTSGTFSKFYGTAQVLPTIGADHSHRLAVGSQARGTLQQNLESNRERMKSIDANALPPASTITGDTKSPPQLPSAPSAAPGPGAGSGGGSGGGPTGSYGSGVSNSAPGRIEGAGNVPRPGTSFGSNALDDRSKSANPSQGPIVVNTSQGKSNSKKDPLPSNQPKTSKGADDTNPAFAGTMPNTLGKVALAGAEERQVHSLMQQLKDDTFGKDAGANSGKADPKQPASERSATGSKGNEIKGDAKSLGAPKGISESDSKKEVADSKNRKDPEAIMAAAKAALAAIKEKYANMEGMPDYAESEDSSPGSEQNEEKFAAKAGGERNSSLNSRILRDITLFERIKTPILKCHAVGCVYYGGS